MYEPLCYAVNRKYAEKGGDGMEKEGKRITRFKTGTTKLQGAAYLREMAENGWILEDMNHLTYSFREEEPQYLKYRMEERESVLTEEERTAYEKDGWTEVCHYELEYVFVKEREPFEEDTEEQKEEIIKDLDWQIRMEETTERKTRHGQMIVLAIGLIMALLVMGFSEATMIFLVRILSRLLPWILIAYFASRSRTKKLRQEQDRVREGDISDEYTDWRKGRRMTISWILVLVLVFVVWMFYAGNYNEKTFDLPKTVSYEEIPAVRLENLVDGPLKRTGRSIDPVMEGVRLNADMVKGIMYDNTKKLGGFDNYVVDHRFLLKTQKMVESYQCMMTEDGRELKLDTSYYKFRGGEASDYYGDVVLNEEDFDESLEALEMNVPKRQLVFVETDAFTRRHACKREWIEGTAYHIICQSKDGQQIMELDYHYSNGDVTVEQLMDEIAKVFAVQTK